MPLGLRPRGIFIARKEAVYGQRAKNNHFHQGAAYCNRNHSAEKGGIDLMKKIISKYACQLVKEAESLEYFTDQAITNPSDAVQCICKLTKLDVQPSEQLWLLLLDSHGSVIGYTMASSGSITRSYADSREIFRTAISLNASAALLFHNHPSGDTTPSTFDINTTKQLIEAGKIIGIRLLDHIIVCDEQTYISMREQKLLEF